MLTPVRPTPWVLLALLALPTLALADEAAPAPPARRGLADAARDVANGGAPEEAELTWPPRTDAATDGWSFDAIPTTDLYRRYVADPRRPRFSVLHLWVPSSEIEDGGKRRVATMFGGRYGFVRLHPDADPERGLQLDVEAGFLAHFDLTHKLDNLGWEGYYGFSLSWRPTQAVALRFAVNHDSSHLGDEYVHETGRERINYTREELALGVSWEPLDVLRLYAEAGWAYHQGTDDDLQEPLRLQAGVEWQTAEPVLWNARWFAALDAVVWQENGWEPSISAMTGLVWHLPRIVREYRLGLQYYDGRSLFGEFFQDRERYVGFGFWFDL